MSSTDKLFFLYMAAMVFMIVGLICTVLFFPTGITVFMHGVYLILYCQITKKQHEIMERLEKQHPDAPQYADANE